MRRTLTLAHVIWLDMLRRKDVYVLAILLGALLAVLVSMDVFGLGGAAGYVADIGLLMVWGVAWILAVMVSSRQLPQEESRGTVFALLAKPVTRLELIAGKWLGATGIVSAATIAFYALVFAVTALKGGRVPGVVLVQAFVLHAMVIATVSAVGVACSTRLNHDAAATLTFIISGAAFLVVPRVPAFVATASGLQANLLLALYAVLPHFEVFDLRMRLVHGYRPIGWGTFGLILLYGAFLVLLFLTAAWLLYRGKRFSRGSLSGY